MTEHEHFVRHMVRPGDYVRTEYECRATETAECRTYCQTCMDTFDDGPCYHGDEAVPVHGQPCNHVAWLNGESEEYYDGDEQPVRGPDWQPITVTWNGDYYVWRYAL